MNKILMVDNKPYNWFNASRNSASDPYVGRSGSFRVAFDVFAFDNRRSELTESSGKRGMTLALGVFVGRFWLLRRVGWLSGL